MNKWGKSVWRSQGTLSRGGKNLNEIGPSERLAWRQT